NDGEKGLGQPNYEPYDGTSMATPLVTGIAALMLEANPSLTLAQIQEAMQSTAVDFSKNEYKLGPGIVNAEAAVRAVMTEEAQPEPTEETPVTETVTNVVTATETATEVKTVEETITEEVEPSEPIVVTETAIREPATTTVFATETQIEKVPGEKITTTVAPEPVTVVKDPVEETTVVEADDVTETSTVTSTRTTTLPQKTVVETVPAGEDETVTAEPSTVTLAPVTVTEPADEPVVTVTKVITPEPGKATVTSTAKETETTTVTSTRRVSDNGSEVPQTTTTVIVAPDRGSSDLDPEDVANGSSHAKKWSVVMLILGILAVLLPQFAQNNLSSFALPDMSRLRTFIK
ncbi:MAG: S8 family serine peptidase, partial [Corynebacterium striatum]|nr:S8 family serine peptidase [Corynebacterium striatum]